MARLRGLQLLILLYVVDTAFTDIDNVTTADIDNHLSNNITDIKVQLPNLGETRRKEKKKSIHRSTSSSSRDAKDRGSSKSGDSMSMSSSTLETTNEKKKKKNIAGKPQSSVERHGWRKWHRKCQRCPEDMVKKWRDPSIKWICGSYQRARRSFKSLCMMHYRNCQDGTMFVKIHDHRCKNDTDRPGLPSGDHFFYEYRAMLSDESEKSGETQSSSFNSASSI